MSKLGETEAPVSDSVALPRDRPLLRLDDFVMRVARTAPGVLAATDVVGAAGVLLAGKLARQVSSPILYVVPEPSHAAAALADARFLFDHFGLHAPQREVARTLLPSEEGPYSDLHPDRYAQMAQMASLGRLIQPEPPQLFIVPAMALARRVPPASLIREATCRLRVGENLDRERVTNGWAHCGYLRVPVVEDPGTFAVRGAIVDVWSPDASLPFRLELEGDALIGIRTFNPEDQRTRDTLERCTVLPVRANLTTPENETRARSAVRALCDAVNWPSSRARHLADEVATARSFFGSQGYLPAFCDLVPLLDYFPSESIVVFEDASSCLAALQNEIDALGSAEHARGEQPHFGLDAWLVDRDAWEQLLAPHRVVSLLRTRQLGQVDEQPLSKLEFVTDETPSLATVEIGQSCKIEGAAAASRGHSEGLERLITQVQHWQAADLDIVITARTSSQADRMLALLSHRGLAMSRAKAAERDVKTPSAKVAVTVGRLARGAVLPLEQLVFVAEEEIFARRAHGAKRQKSTTKSALLDLRSLSVGDFVVHEEHGVGRYLGLERRIVDGVAVELITVEYEGGRLFVPVYRLNQVQKHSGAEGQPKLDRLGGLSFAKTKAKVQRRLRQLADELLHLYSERVAARKQPLAAVDDEYATFEATFPFEETRDQATAIADVLSDLEAEKVMDRLVCGDVGFGKTEVALRAAFRMAMAARQVAVLCPTTVLSQQHFQTFRDRLQEFGLEVRALSRLIKGADATRTLDDLKRGTVDVVVGTHRLLSKDVHFKNLGLLVIDEEQRFGVSHKERIKQIRKNVDVLTLSATPIPRTLQMAVGGLRDMSVIETPPIDRRPIRTILAHIDADLVTDGIRRELARSGQVYYVHNRISGLDERAAKLSAWVPEARIAVAHGQMRPEALENTMLKFVAGEYDILVCTAIVESGLDIARANTMFIDRADLFGLAQLYQLRGRIGRSPERAYCYLLVPSMSELDEQTKTRLETIERFTELGMGMRVAALDMELRGAGDLLGAEQSGFVASVGFELFCRLLQDATHEAQGQPVVHEVEPDLTVDVEALIPEDYITDVGIRLGFYKQFAAALSSASIDDTALQMEDRFGSPPAAARNLIALMRLKTMLRQLKVMGCNARQASVDLVLRSDTPIHFDHVQLVQAQSNGSYRITPDSRLIRKAGPDESFPSGLAHAECMMAELESCSAILTE